MKRVVFALLIAACPAWATADTMRGSEFKARVLEVLDALGQAGHLEVSPHRAFPACPGPLAVRPKGAGWQSVTVSCARTGWSRVFRLNGGAAGHARRTSTVAQATQQALTLRESLSRGTVLSAEHLILAAIPAQPHSGHITAEAMAIGRALRVNLSAGQVLLARHLEFDWHVEEGAPVTISMLRGPIRIEAAGRAQASGQLGEVISVANANSGALVHATVTGVNKVEVSPNMRRQGAVVSCRDTVMRCEKE